MIKSLLVVCLSLSCISPVIPIGDGKSRHRAQRETMTNMGPARLATGTKWSGEVTTKKIRIWADVQYRTQNRKWQESFSEPLELANLVITPAFGLALEADYRVWDRHEPGARLTEDLVALQAHDAGDDVFAVVGLTSSLPLVSATYEELGMAMVNGRHIMLRGYADLEERKAYENSFPDLRPEEREYSLQQLRHHKTAVVFLHELGHILGVEHETDSSTIMNGAYSTKATTFSATSRAIMKRTIDLRLGKASPEVMPPPDTKPVEKHERVVIEVTKAGDLMVDGERQRWDEIYALLKAAFAADPNTLVKIDKDRKAPASVVGDLVERAKSLGLTKFEFGWTGR